MVTEWLPLSPSLRSALRLDVWTSSACPGARRQLRWIAAHEAQSTGSSRGGLDAFVMWLPFSRCWVGCQSVHASNVADPPDGQNLITLPRDRMRALIYYSLMLLLGFAWYKFGQNLLRKGHRDENDEPTQGLVGPVGFLMSAVVACVLFFAMLRALVWGEVPCIGKACSAQVYTLAASSGDYWANVLSLLWLVLALGYAMYVTLRIWFRA
jgi:hypothetical protein